MPRMKLLRLKKKRGKLFVRELLYDSIDVSMYIADRNGTRAISSVFFFLKDPAPPEIYTLPLHAALPISLLGGVLTSPFGWLSVLFVNAPIGWAAMLLPPWLIAESRGQLARRSFDLPGAATVTAEIGRAHV